MLGWTGKRFRCWSGSGREAVPLLVSWHGGKFSWHGGKRFRCWFRGSVEGGG